MSKRLLIAVDGPAASGKGTLAKKLAAHYGLPHLDTGLLYRAVARKAMDADVHSDDGVAALARALSPEDLADETLSNEDVGQQASVISAIPEVRAALLDYQQQFATHPKGAVLDGRDIGTVICPQADVKLFITASAEVRAERRFKQQEQLGYDAILEAIRARDARDMERAAAPLKPAEDAVVLDTSAMGIDAVLAAALKIVAEKRA